MAAMESSVELLPWMAWYHQGYHIRETRSWLEMQVTAFRIGTAYEFAIESPSGRYLGGCGINQLDPMNRRANIGYWAHVASKGGDKMMFAGEAFDGAFGWVREHPCAHENIVIEGIGHSGVLYDQRLFHHWADEHLLDIYRADITTLKGRAA